VCVCGMTQMNLSMFPFLVWRFTVRLFLSLSLSSNSFIMHSGVFISLSVYNEAFEKV